MNIPPMSQEKLIIVMVGLPARGKSYITKKISNYLRWFNVENKVFNVGNKRRCHMEDEQTADFFDPNDTDNVKIRDELAIDTLDDVLHYLENDGQVGIFDATNSTIRRRRMVIDYINAKCSHECNILFLESICNNRSLIEENMGLKLHGPDYKDHVNKNKALEDFKQRLQNYEAVYETVNRSEFDGEKDQLCQYLKIIDVYSIKSFNIQGFLPMMLHSFLQHFNIFGKRIWIIKEHVDYRAIKDIDTSNLKVFSSSVSATRRIPPSLSLDQVHDFILEVEASHSDVLIQSQDELLINGLVKYFNILELSGPDLDFNMHFVCILPHQYTDRVQRFDIIEIPNMTRSNSNLSNVSSVITPRDDLVWTQFNYQNLNLSELSSKLEQLKE